MTNESFLGECPLCGQPFLREHNREMLAALRKVDEYFTACAKAWAVDDGKVVNADGHVIAEGDDLDRLCNIAANATARALAKAEQGLERSTPHCGPAPPHTPQ